ncbi:MAG: serine hydrolase domain-containing protein [bacterium]
MNTNKLNKVIEEKEFSGVVYIEKEGKVIFEEAYGYADRSNLIPNKINTSFGIASGCKLFTAIAILQLIEKGSLSLDTYLKDCLKIDFPKFDPSIKIRHLLNHSSGVPDYFDEEVMDDFSVLWENTPMYMIRELKDFLPMFKDGKMDFEPGKKFKYNNAGFILLGLIVEEVSGISFREYVKVNIFDRYGMDDSGYFALDKLPANTAYGYEQDESGEWKSNIYSVPVIGGADGVAFTTASDLSRLWKGLQDNKILSKETIEDMLSPQIQVDDDCYYGHGIWLIKNSDKVSQYYIVGEDPGVTMISSVFPQEKIKLTILANTEYGTWEISGVIEEMLKLS